MYSLYERDRHHLDLLQRDRLVSSLCLREKRQAAPHRLLHRPGHDRAAQLPECRLNKEFERLLGGMAPEKTKEFDRLLGGMVPEKSEEEDA